MQGKDNLSLDKKQTVLLKKQKDRCVVLFTTEYYGVSQSLFG
ncbi:hypothetical protein M106_3527 [Bacteroides fragilis str. 1009-4-F |nr:hypothetical protein M106_3527 [Bacteroides fragilis str. 1009-4-F \